MRPSCNKYKRTGTTRVATLRVAWLTHFQLVGRGDRGGRRGGVAEVVVGAPQCMTSAIISITRRATVNCTPGSLLSPLPKLAKCNVMRKWNEISGERERERKRKKRKATKQITGHVKEVKEKTPAKLVDIVGERAKYFESCSRVA